MGEPASEFNESDSEYSGPNPDYESTEEELIRLDLNPDSEDESINESTASDLDSDGEYQPTMGSTGLDSNSNHEHELHGPPTGWDRDSDEDENQRPLQSEFEYQLPVRATGWDWHSDDDEYQPPVHSGHEDQLPIEHIVWDLDMDDEYRPRSLYFQHVCRCLPFSKYKSSNLERGDKIVMPPSYLGEIISLGLEFPLFFQIENINSNIISHCGVLEFDGTEGFIFMPEWMMKNLKLNEEDHLIIRSASLAPGTYMKLQPHATAFTKLSHPKVVLEKTLRDFTCLSRGDTFMIRHNERDFYFDVLEVAPSNAISLLETDCEVEFALPLDYKEPEPDPEPEPESMDVVGKKEDSEEFRPFMGTARRLDGNPVTVRPAVPTERNMSAKDDGKEAGKEKFKPFTGRSHTLGSS